jgi:putative acetyltransferase
MLSHGMMRSPKTSLIVEHVQSPTPDARALIEELEAELSRSYSSEQRHGLSVERIFQSNVRFFVARVNDEPVGCGGIAFEDGFAELKRMYVRPAARGRRVASAVLTRLEGEARSCGVGRLRLETGDAQTSAIRFYEREGFTRCGAFGVYATMPAESVRRCVFFEKLLQARR